jgi:ABC-2 type transport system ATP-binding protein
VIELRDVSKWYGSVVAVNAVNCQIAPGITGLLGPNGAGKSTVLHMVAGLLSPSGGSVTIDGKPATGDANIYRTLGFVPERESVYPFLTGREFVQMNASLQKLADVKDATDRAIKLVDLESAQHRKIGTYSKGMRQRIKLAGAMVHEPKLLVLDEPFNGMDPRQRVHMMDVLHQQAKDGATVLISSHILEELRDLATNVLVMVEGRLAASGHYREIRRLMTDRPHAFTMRSSDDRKLAAALMAEPSVFSVELGAAGMSIRTSDRGAFTRAIPRIARGASVSIQELRPTDESLESVFSYLVER